MCRLLRYTCVKEERDKKNNDSVDKGLYDRILKYTGMFGGVQGLVALVTIVRTKIVARLLGTVGFGLSESFNRTLNFVRSTTDLGIPFSAVRTISSGYENKDEVVLAENVLLTRSWSFFTAVAGAVLCVILAPLFSLWAFDGDRGYTLSFILLSPVVAFTTITGGEMAVLKGLRKLREIASAQLISVILTLFISVPLFCFMGLRGLVPSLVLVSLMVMIVTCRYSFRTSPYRIALLRKDMLRKGTEMVRLGVFFTIASFLGSGTFTVIANYLMNHGGAETVGAYSAGYALVNYLAMFLFSAMDSEYFPRLSSSVSDCTSISSQMNKQMEMSLLLAAPMVAAFVTFLEPAVRILLTDKFFVAVPMTRIAVMSLLFKAMTQPAAYVSLAKGDSRTYLVQESLYDVFLAVAVVLGFEHGGLEYVGLAITLAGVFDLLMVFAIVRIRYSVGPDAGMLRGLLPVLLPVVAVYASVTFLDGYCKWLCASAALAVSSLMSWRELEKRTSFISKLKGRFHLK